MQQINLPPNASRLCESLKGMGYSLHTAVADILDNSITAKASEIRIKIQAKRNGQESWLIVEDNGSGMDREGLLTAMRLGSVSPFEKRDESDLGRFGLGLKTASFSQTRRLTVLSKKDGIVNCLEWNLDLLQEIKNEGGWYLIDYENSIDDPRLQFSSDRDSGTIVLWSGVSALEHLDEKEFSEIVRDLIQKLRLMFHRFLESNELKIFVNDKTLTPINPFFENDPRKPKDFPKAFWPPLCSSPKIAIEPYLIPVDALNSSSDFTEEENYKMQGFFVYRCKRLISYGSWLGLKGLQDNEGSSLVRIKLDFLNLHDDEWKIDIKKSSVKVPKDAKDWLIRYALYARTESERILKRRASKTIPEEVKDIPNLWKKERGECPQIDDQNLIIKVFSRKVSEGALPSNVFEGFMKILAVSHPKIASRNLPHDPDESEKSATFFLFEALSKEIGTLNAINFIKSQVPFSRWPVLMMELSKEE